MKNLVFVSTYAIGNEFGFGIGEWFNLNNYADSQDFGHAAYEFAVKLQKEAGIENYKDVELAFPDFDVAPLFRRFVSEYGINESIWDMLNSSQVEINVVNAYLDAFGISDKDVDLNEIKNKAFDCYVGYYESDIDYAYEYLESTGYLNNLPSIIENNIDMKSVAFELMFDVSASDNHYFYAH